MTIHKGKTSLCEATTKVVYYEISKRSSKTNRKYQSGSQYEKQLLTRYFLQSVQTLGPNLTCLEKGSLTSYRSLSCSFQGVFWERWKSLKTKISNVGKGLGSLASQKPRTITSLFQMCSEGSLILNPHKSSGPWPGLGVDCPHTPCSMRTSSPDCHSVDLFGLAMDGIRGVGSLRLTTWYPTGSLWWLSQYEESLFFPSGLWKHLLSPGGVLGTQLSFPIPYLQILPASRSHTKYIIQAQYQLSLQSFRELKPHIFDPLGRIFWTLFFHPLNIP